MGYFILLSKFYLLSYFTEQLMAYNFTGNKEPFFPQLKYKVSVQSCF